MNPALIPAAILLAITLTGLLLFRGLPVRIRAAFDIACFAAISLYLLDHQIFPLFPPLKPGPVESGALWLRAIGGAWWLLGARILVGGIWFALHRDRRAREAKLFSDLSAAGIYIATGAIILNSVFALPVTGLVATSGVVAIVLGLALQNTLADVFAGITVGIEAPFGVGDRVLVGDKIEGRIVQMNWRSIRVQTDGDDLAIIPNSLVAKAELINRSFPTLQRASSVDIICPAHAVPDRVVEALLHATLLCPAIQTQPAPGAVLQEMGFKRHIYRISFTVEKSSQLTSTKDLLLRAARRQLAYAGLLDRPRGAQQGSPAERLLADLIVFDGLDRAQITNLADQIELKQAGPGDTLFIQGGTDPALFIVAAGIVAITRKTAEAEETLGCIGAGEYVGEIGLLTGAPHAATATARTHCRIYRLPRELIAPLLSNNAVLAAAFEHSVRRGLDLLNRDVAARATPDIGTKGQLLARIAAFFHSGK